VVAIAPAADPEPEGPVGRYRRLAGQAMVGLHDGCDAVADDQVNAQVIGAGGCLPGRDRCLAELVIERPGHVEEDAIARRAQQERDVLVSAVTADAEGVDRPGRKRLAATVEGTKMLAQAEERLIRFEPGGQPAQPAGMTGRKMVEAAADVAIVWLVGEAHHTSRVFEAHAKRSAIDLDTQRVCRVGPPIGPVLRFPRCGRRRIVDQQPRWPGCPSAEMETDDVGRHRSNLDRESGATVVLRDQLDRLATRANAAHERDRSRVTREKIAGRARRFGRYQPRWIHSSRWGRSRPMVVDLPWPGST
jgi:hypothetical protein